MVYNYYFKNNLIKPVSQLVGIKEPGQSDEIWRNFYTDGRVAEQLDAFDTTFTFDYDPENSKTTMTDRRGYQSVVDYDSNFWVTKQTNPLGNFAEYVYSDFDRPDRIIDERGWTTYFTYDTNGNNTSTIDQEGHEIEALYDLSNNNLLWEKDALERQTTYTYDATGTFPRSIAKPIGTTYLDYYNDGLVKTITDDNSHTTDFRYDASGNLTKLIYGQSKETTMGYDSAGRLTGVKDARGYTARFDYDNAGNVTAVKDPLSLIYPAQRHQVDFTYDDRGNQKTFMDSENNLSEFKYDIMNNLKDVVDAAESTTSYEYDANFNLTKVIDARQKTTVYDYDPNDRLKSITDPLGRTLRYTYDQAGNTSDTVYPNGNETYYQYFKNNLLKSISYKNEPTSYSFTYNPTRTLKDVTDNSGTTWSFGYDGGNRLVGSTDTINSTYGGFVINRSYDGVSNLTGVKAPAETTTAYSYNARDDLTDIDIPGGAADEIGFSYDDARNRTNISMPGSVTNTFGFDPANRVTTVTIDTASTDSDFLYAHDANGNVTKITKSTWGGAVTEYGYDELNRLTDWYNPDSDTTTTYGYDKTGNLLTVKENGVTTKTLAYNDANQISSAGYSYDDNGNMVEDGDHYYTYDGENRVKQVVSKVTSQTVASYAYDYMGRRISSTDASGAATKYHYDGWNVTAETQGATITARYYYDNKGQITAMKKDGNTYYYQFNAHGDVVSLTDASGNVVNSYEYDPWGNHLSTSETVANPYRYAGYRFDEDTGLYYLRARYYSPGDYRFLTRDRWAGNIEIPHTLNTYIYALDNPVRFIDKTGRDVWDILDVGDKIASVVGVAGAAISVGAPEIGVPLLVASAVWSAGTSLARGYYGVYSGYETAAGVTMSVASYMSFGTGGLAWSFFGPKGRTPGCD